MAAAYPLTIRTILRANKARQQPAAFRTSEPRRGYAYSQATGTDTPVIWDVAFRFTAPEALVFQLWFEEIINRGVDEFTLPIRTEFGTLTHTCRFLDDSLLPTTEAGETFGYTAKIMARAKLIPDGYRDAADLIVTLPAWTDWAELLDITINAEMPGA